jgi:pimeloyl-ACP methyl ester carboxylesterase
MTERTPLLLIPGLLCDGTVWRHQTEHLADVAAVTVADVMRRDSMAGLAEDALAQAPSGRFALAGLSMGGYVAFEIMRRAPERISRLAILDSSARPESEASRARRLALIAQARQGDFKGVTRRLLPLFIHADRLNDDALSSTVMAMTARVGREAFLRQQQAILSRSDSRTRLGDIRVPTLILCGREDALTPLDLHEDMAARVPHAALVVVEHCGHLSTLEQPEAVTAVMRYWLQQ